MSYEYEMEQGVYSVALGSPKGIIIGRRMTTEPYEYIEYLVAFEYNETLWMGENELRLEKTII